MSIFHKYDVPALIFVISGLFILLIKNWQSIFEQLWPYDIESFFGIAFLICLISFPIIWKRFEDSMNDTNVRMRLWYHK